MFLSFEAIHVIKRTLLLQWVQEITFNVFYEETENMRMIHMIRLVIDNSSMNKFVRLLVAACYVSTLHFATHYMLHVRWSCPNTRWKVLNLLQTHRRHWTISPIFQTKRLLHRFHSNLFKNKFWSFPSFPSFPTTPEKGMLNCIRNATTFHFLCSFDHLLLAEFHFLGIIFAQQRWTEFSQRILIEWCLFT